MDGETHTNECTVRQFIVRFLFGLTALVLSGGLLANTDLSRFHRSLMTMSDEEIQTMGVHQAKHSDLASEEWVRYIELLRGPLGYWNPSIDPLLALGMFAQNRDEERIYAERYAKQEHALTVRALRFQRAYQGAFARLYPDASLTDKRLLTPYVAHREQRSSQPLLPAKQSSPRLRKGDRLRVFVSQSCDLCDQLLPVIAQQLTAIDAVRVDVFVVNAANDSDVRQWAQTHAINPQWVLSNRMTLNRDDGELARLRQHTDEPDQPLPLLFLQRESKVFQLRVSDWGV